MKKYAHISYNLYCNFTNYGSALHTYALQEVMNGIAPGQVESIVLDYCPDVLKDKDILNPIKNLWDADEESKRMIELSMPAIRMNNDKFKQFYRKYYKLSSQKYTSENFNDSLAWKAYMATFAEVIQYGASESLKALMMVILAIIRL